MDRIKTQQFKDRGRISWVFIYTTERGRTFEVYYDVTNMGHCREIISERLGIKDLKTLLVRELRIGEVWSPTAREFIEAASPEDSQAQSSA